MANDDDSAGSAPTSPAATRALEWLRSLSHTPRNPQEALALAVHALLLGHGFRDADVDAEGADDAARPARLHIDWGVGGYGGRYRHARSALVFEVRATPLGARLRVTGAHDAAARNDDVATLDLPVATHYIAPPEEAPWTDGLRDLDAAATLVLVQVAHRLVPDAAKEGYEAGASSNDNGAGSAAARPAPPPARMPPPPMPDYDNDPLRIGPVRGGPRNPFLPPYGPGGVPAPGGFGSDDLMPQMPRMPGFGGGHFGGGMGGGIGGGMGGGNLMGPRNFMPPNRGGHPMRGGPPMFGTGRGRLPPGVPPGARYDPMGPGGVGPDNTIERPPPDDDDPPSGMYW